MNFLSVCNFKMQSFLLNSTWINGNFFDISLKISNYKWRTILRYYNKFLWRRASNFIWSREYICKVDATFVCRSGAVARSWSAPNCSLCLLAVVALIVSLAVLPDTAALAATPRGYPGHDTATCVIKLITPKPGQWRPNYLPTPRPINVIY